MFRVLGQSVLTRETGIRSMHNTAGSPRDTALLSAIAATSQHIGLVATVNCNFDHPHHVARKFASLDHNAISMMPVCQAFGPLAVKRST